MKVIASILGALGILKVIGMIVLVVSANETKEAIWFIKQSVYAICLIGIATYIFTSKKKECDQS